MRSARTTRRAHGPGLDASVVLAAFTTLLACKVPNEDHCLHRASDGNAWCAESDPELPYCSPCEATQHGCVATEPPAELCPSYSPAETQSEPATDTSEGTDSDSGSGS